MPHDPRLLATAIDIVLKAGELQMASFGRDVEVVKKGEIDLVTDVDLAVESMFRQVIADRFPGHGILAEEALTPEPAGASASSYRWIFDPIDGTTNFAHGLPVFCAALGLEIDGRVEIAAVFDPTRRELFTAERGGGSYLNGSRLHVSQASTLLDSMLVTGFPYDVHDNPGDILGLFGAFIGRARAVRRLGSAALDLCYVAAGRMDGFWEQRLKPWDVAGATLVVSEAGGTVTGIDGSALDIRGGHVLASNGRIHPEMLETIAGYRQSRSRNRTV
jgi:myo-inositol-1(or 4)-monophosphatase